MSEARGLTASASSELGFRPHGASPLVPFVSKDDRTDEYDEVGNQQSYRRATLPVPDPDHVEYDRDPDLQCCSHPRLHGKAS